MKAVVAAFNQEKALVGAFSVITNLRMEFGCNFLRHYLAAGGVVPGHLALLVHTEVGQVDEHVGQVLEHTGLDR